jgi:hypothetical protein
MQDGVELYQQESAMMSHEKRISMRLDENVNWLPLISATRGRPRGGIRPSDAIFSRAQLFPPAHNNSAYLRLTVMQDGKEHIIILPFDDFRLAKRFDSELVDLVGQTLETLGAVEVD